MFRLIRLFGALFSLSLRRTLAFRADMFFELVTTCISAAASLAALGMVFSRTDSLGGWSAGEATALLGTFQVVTGLRSTFVEPNLAWFGGQVKTGQFDAVLLQPAPTIFLASLGAFAPLALIQVGVGLCIVIGGIVQAGLTITAAEVLGWLVVVAAASVVMWATRLMLASLVFWAFGLDLDVLYDAIWQFARYPVSIYSPVLRIAFTYALPVALIATVPVEALMGGGVVAAAAVAAGAGVIAWLIWHRGLRRYTSATS